MSKQEARPRKEELIEPVDRAVALRERLESLQSCLVRGAPEASEKTAALQISGVLKILEDMMQSHRRLILDYENDKRHANLLVSVVTQGLRQIEHSVTGLLQLLESSGSVSPHLLAVLEGNLLSVGHLMGDLESFSEIRAREFVVRNFPFSVIGLMDEVIACFQPRADSQCVRLNHRFAPGIPDQVIGDRGRLKQCLVSMLENSWRLTKQGEIVLELDWQAGAHASLILRVTDTGIGLASGGLGVDALKPGGRVELLNPTEIAAVEYGILHEIASRLGARFQWESVPGKGTTCTLRYPVALLATASDVASSAEGKSDDPSIPQNGKSDAVSRLPSSGATPRVDFCRVLIVEDDRISAMVFKRLLERMNCHATVAEDGELAIGLIEREDYELIFMDCIMPGMDGFETTERIRASGRSTIPIIAVTASVHPNTRSNCIRSGMNDVLSKPVDVTVLQSTIERWLGDRLSTGVDRLEGMKRSKETLGYSDVLFRRLLTHWRDSYSPWLHDLRECVRSASTDAGLRQCYRIRSSLSCLGIESAYSGIRQIEEYLKSGRWHAIPNLLQSLEAVMLDARSRVDCFLKNPEGSDPEGRESLVDRWEWRGVTTSDVEASGLVVIDPDPVDRWVFEEYEQAGLRLHCFESFAQALIELDFHDWQGTGCLVVSEEAGLDDPLGMVRSALELNPDLSVILLAHFPSRDLVNQALKIGVQEIIQKPLALPVFHPAFRSSVLETARRKRQREQQEATARIGSAQKKMLTRSAGIEAGIDTQVYCQPRSDAGGDFWVKLPATARRQVYLLTDVSGHDVEAAFVSAYFHGLVRGFQESAVSSTREALEAFNRFLCHEWNQGSSSTVWVEKSVACCAIEVDQEAETLVFHLCGSCIPIVQGIDGSLRKVTSQTGVPLGWFDQCEIVSARILISDIRSIYLWSDGIEDLAEHLGINPMSLAHTLLSLGEDAPSPDWATGASDDLLTICMRPEARSETSHIPVFLGMYSGDEGAMIDVIQERLGNTLRFRDPEIPDDTLHALLLCSREGLLNALNHGCRSDPLQSAVLSVVESKIDRSYRIVVKDDGAPMSECIFETHMHEGELHRGLNLIQAFSKDLHFHGPEKTLSMTIPYQFPTEE
jgi:CheY-like chemotaxis protein